jgi:hypothetical protein
MERTMMRPARLDIAYSKEVETPHIKWADPFVNGPLRPFIVNGVHTGRTVVELMQRLTMEPRVVSIDPDFGVNRWWGERYRYDPLMNSEPHEYSASYQVLEEELLRNVRYDCLVMHSMIGWNDMPLRLRELIYARVRGGEGLVLVHPQLGQDESDDTLWAVSPIINVPATKLGRRAHLIHPVAAMSGEPWRKAADHYLVNGIPFEALPYPALRHYRYELGREAEALASGVDGSPVIAVKEYGEGRVVGLGYVSHALWPQLEAKRGELNENFWEYLCSVLMRAIVWAARKEPPVQLLAVEPEPARGTAQVRLRNAGAAVQASVAVAVCDEFRNPERKTTKRVALGAGETMVEVPLPKGEPPCGRHFVDAIVSAGGVRHDWGTGTYEVARPARIARVKLDQEAVAGGGTVTGTARLTGTPRGLHLVSELWDQAGRLLDRKRAPVGAAKQAAFRLRCPEAITNTAWVKCFLLDDERFVDEARVSLALTAPRPEGWTDYEVQMPWHHTGVYPWSSLIEEQLVAAGITSTADPTLNFWMTADLHCPGFGIGWWERHDYIKQRELYGQTRDISYLKRTPCFHSDEFKKPVRETLRRRIPPALKYSPRVYYISDEASVTGYEDAFDLCWGEETLAEFRKWLRAQYRTLDALNAEWDTRYQSWDQVMPATWEEAQQRGNPAPWVDHRLFMNHTFAGAFAYAAAICRKLDPVGLVTVSGTQLPSSHNGCDWWLVDKVVDYLQPYSGGGQDEMHRSFNPNLVITGFTGYQRYGLTLQHEIWHRFLHGHAGASIFWSYSMVDPDLTLNAQGRSMRDNFGELRGEGLYRTLRDLKRDHDGLALHYSMASGHVWWIQDGALTYHDLEYGLSASASFRRFINNRVRWSQLLEDIGYQYDYVAYDPVEQGWLREGKFRALILPGSIALSDGEVEQIKGFVRAGGLLIADVMPATTDGHGKPRAESALAEVFAAEAYGKGRAVLLDQWLASIPEEDRLKVAGASARAEVRAALEEAGVRPSVSVIGEGDAHPVGIERVSWRDRHMEVIGLLRELEGRREMSSDGIVVFTPTAAAAQPAPVRVRRAAEGHWYDLRAHKYLGLKREVRTTLTGGQPRLYAVLPYRVEGLDLSVSGGEAPGAAVKYRVQVQADAARLAKSARGGSALGRHVVKIDVYGPDGKRRRFYSGTVEARRGAGTGGFRLAQNDPSGEWRIVAMDCTSGVKAEQQMVVK